MRKVDHVEDAYLPALTAVRAVLVLDVELRALQVVRLGDRPAGSALAHSGSMAVAICQPWIRKVVLQLLEQCMPALR